ncbi:MAG: DEAD/DEAH box helicase [Synergistaceae bacterium]|jgi:ATP-dependent RNA helicase DeaD|nr:DEAD/DEAH box helicase [Synergistaceae bacterium]
MKNTVEVEMEDLTTMNLDTEPEDIANCSRETTFDDFGVRSELLKAITRKGFTSPTPVQQKVLESNAAEKDLIVRAKTGSGKTLAFLLPLLQNMKTRERAPRMLILSPTRELAQQIARETEWLVSFMNISVVSLVGGLEMSPQLRALRDGAAIVVGTPGRTLDHVERGSLDTKNIDCVVLDEGDQMLDMGFRDELEGILNALPAERRTWLFSATMPPEVRELSKRYLKNPVTISLVQDGAQHEDIVHRVYMIPSRRRFEGLVNILLWERPKRSLMFCHTRLESIEMAQRLQDEGFNAAALHGDMTQRERNAVLASFKSGSMPHLVATNVAARGLDVEGVTHVIQLGLPDDKETFVHRSGRTGRAGHEGTNLILLSPLEAGRFKMMLRSTQMKVEWQDVPSLPLIRTAQREVAEEKLLTFQMNSESQSGYMEWASDLLQRAEPKVLVAKLLETLNSRTAKGYSLNADLDHERERRQRSASRIERGEGRGEGQEERRFSSSRPRGTITRLRSSQGAIKDVGRILNALCSALKVERCEVGAIRLKDDHVLVELLPVALARLEQGWAGLAKWGLFPEDNPVRYIKTRSHDARSHDAVAKPRDPVRPSRLSQNSGRSPRDSYERKGEGDKEYREHAIRGKRSDG